MSVLTAIEHDFLPPFLTEGGFIDRVRVEEIGVVRVSGWSNVADYYPKVTVIADEQIVKEIGRYRLYRPDVVAVESVDDNFCGFCLEYKLAYKMEKQGELESVKEKHIKIFAGENELLFEIDHKNSPCGYSFLIDGKKVFKRQDIYKSALNPPIKFSQIVIDLIMRQKGPILDFGCGSGVYVKELRRMGVKAYGVDLNIDWVRKSIPLRIRPFIHLYDGVLPTKYKDDSFRTVCCIESLEHIDNYEECIAEVKRITSEVAIFTVPDVDAITTCSADYVVPWHLLEAQHLNFFTQNNLRHLLGRYFSTVSFVKIHPHNINNSLFYGNICAVCYK